MKIVTLGESQVIGRAVRTTNAAEMAGDGAIPKQWAAMAGQFPGDQPDAPHIALYTEYESDENGEYTYLLGSKCTAGSVARDGMVIRTIPAGRYAVFTSERGPVPKVVVETWMRIWTMRDYTRSFVADFEVYDERAADPQNTVIDIYVGVK